MYIAFVGFAVMGLNVICFIRKYAKRLGALVGAAKASSATGDASKRVDEDNDGNGQAKSSEGDGEILSDFFDSGYTHGLDDSDTLEINPVMMYKMNQAKRRQREAARAAQLGLTPEQAMEQAAGGATAGGGGGGGGRPGGLARLGFKLKGKGKDDDKRNMSKEIKGIEMYLSREEDIDVKHEATSRVTAAGSGGRSVLDVAKSKDHTSNLGRLGGRRGSIIAGIAHDARAQLGQIREARPEFFAKNVAAAGRDAAFRKSVIGRSSTRSSQVRISLGES